MLIKHADGLRSHIAHEHSTAMLWYITWTAKFEN